MDLDKGHKYHLLFTDDKNAARKIQLFTGISKEGNEEKQGWLLEEYKDSSLL